MRAVVQRVQFARVKVEDEVVGEIGPGLLVYLGVGPADTSETAAFMAAKVAGLRIFEDDDGRMSRSVTDTSGAILVVSQFTLYGDVRKGRRPSFTAAAGPEQADALYQEVVSHLRTQGIETATGRFRAHMHVSSLNDGPVTLLVDSDKVF